jgi:hypothetical protein
MILTSKLTPEYLQSIDWEAPIKDIPIKTCEFFWQVFFAAAKVAEEKGDVTGEDLYLLLGKSGSLHLRPEEKITPFAPMAIFGTRRSADISDFSDDDVEVFKLIFPYLRDNDLRARIADVIWLVHREGNFQFAELAVDAYLLAAAEQLQVDPYSHGVDRITRAIHLAASLGRRADKFEQVVQKIESSIEPFLPRYNSPISMLVKLLLEYGRGDLQKLAEYTEICALDAEAHNNWLIAGHYWELKATCHRRAKQEDQEYAALQRLAITYVHTAQEFVDSGRGYSAAAHHIQSAIEVIRRITNTKKQQDQLHKTMLEYQKKSLGELGHITSGTIDLTEQIESAIAVVKDKPLRDAIFSLALFTNPVGRNSMEKFIDEMAKESPLLALITSNVVNSSGKVVAKRDSLISGSTDQIAKAKEAEMFHWAQSEQSILGSVIEHTRRFLMTEHNPSIRDMLEIVANNPFVPLGREIIYAQGLLSGLYGDYLLSLHLLIPQVENSIRNLLNRNNVITTSLNSDGIQEEFDLARLLDMPETAKIFHEDLIFGLKGTLTSKFGINFRNLLAHGLLDHNYFISYDAAYVWWLILKICCMPMVAQQESTDAPTKE